MGSPNSLKEKTFIPQKHKILEEQEEQLEELEQQENPFKEEEKKPKRIRKRKEVTRYGPKTGPTAPVKLNTELIEDLAQIQCTVAEIAAIMHCSCDVIYDNYYDAVKRGWEIGKISLRRAMWKKGINEGNTTMLIWLSKNILEFSEKHEVKAVEESTNDRLVIDFGEMKKPYINGLHKRIREETIHDAEKVKNRIKKEISKT